PRRLQRRREFHLLDVASGLIRLERMLAALEQLSGARLAVWHVDGRRVPAGAGAPDEDDWAPLLAGRSAGHAIDTPRGPAWFEPVPDVDGVWLEIRGPGDGPPPRPPGPRPPSAGAPPAPKPAPPQGRGGRRGGTERTACFNTTSGFPARTSALATAPAPTR